MKKMFFVVFLLLAATGLYAQPYYLAGDFQGWSSNTTLMYDDGTNGDAVAGDGIYSREYAVAAAGFHGWKVTDGGWTNTWPTKDSWFETTTANQVVLFTINTNTFSDVFFPKTKIISSNEVKPTSIVALGDWQSNAGESGNWINNSTKTVMHDDGLDGDLKAGDGIYTIHISTLPAGTWSGRPVKSGGWNGWGADGRSQDATNLSFTTTSANQHVYMYLNINTGRVAIKYDATLTPVLTSLKSSINFGGMAKNMTKKDTIRIVNSASIALTIDSIYTKSAVFTVDKSRATVGSDTLKIIVTYAPSSASSFADTVYLRNNSSAPLVKIPLSGSAFDAYYIAGDFQGWNASSTLMYDDGTNGDVTANDGIYSREYAVASAGFHGWKATSGSFSQTWPSKDSWFETTAANQTVLFTINTNTLSDVWLPKTKIVCTNELKPASIVALGDWQSNAGESGNWINNSTKTVMHDDGLDGDLKAGDGIYTIHISTLPAGTWSGRPVKSGSWNGWGTDGRSQDATNMSFTTTSANQHVYMFLNTNTGRVAVTIGNPFFPELTLLKTSVSFAVTAKNSTSKDTVRIMNGTLNQLTIDSIYTKTSVFKADRVTASVGSDTLKLIVSFTPVAAGTFVDTVYLRNNSLTPLVKVPVTGSSPAPGLYATVTAMAFGNKMKGDSASLTAYLKNSSISPVTISSMSTVNTVFKASAGSMTVGGNDSTLLTVKFKPASFAAFVDTAVIVSDGGTVKIALSGASPAPVLTSSKQSIAYNFAAINTVKKDSLLLSNSSINTLVIDSIYTKTTAFTVSRTAASIGADTVKIVVTFAPTTAAVFADTLYLRNNTASTPVKIPLSGQSIVTYYLAGDFQGWSSNTTLMYDDGTNGDVLAKDSTYSRSYTVAAAGFHGWKATNGTWDATWPSKDCWFETAAANQSILFTLNTKIMNDGWLPNTNIVLTDDVKPTNLVAVGNWQSKAGETGDWVNNSTKTVMHDDGLDGDYKAGDGIYAYHISTLPAGTYQIKSVKSGTWNSWGADGRSQDGTNLTFTTTAANQHVYFYTNINTGRITLTFDAPLQPSLKSLKSSIAFGTVLKGIAKKDTIRIINGTLNPLTIDSIYVKNAVYSVDIKKGTVGKTDTLKIIVTFTPNAAGSFIDSVYLSNNSAAKLVKIPLSGNGTLTAVEEMMSGIPAQYELSQNFPNPFNPSTTIRYALPNRSFVRIQVFNILGQKIEELVNLEQAAGYQTVTWNARVTSGIYMFRIEAVDTENPDHRLVETKKMSLIR